MRLVRWLVLLLSVVGWVAAGAAPLRAQPAEEAAIRGVLEKQAADWNAGDLPAFESGYKNSPDIIFMGKTVRRGYAGMAESYRRNYGTAAKRGRLSFTDLEVHVLDARFATAIGRFHLERTAAGGGDAEGEFSLVFERTAAGWKIILDHTGEDAPRAGLRPAAQ